MVVERHLDYLGHLLLWFGRFHTAPSSELVLRGYCKHFLEGVFTLETLDSIAVLRWCPRQDLNLYPVKD